MIKIKDGTPDQKIEHIERILNRMSRKLHNTVIGVMPAIPVMFSTDEPKENGEIFKFLLPCKGHISTVCMYVNKFDGSEAIAFEAAVRGPITGSNVRFLTKKNLTVENANLPVFAGDMITLTTETPESVHGIWIALLYQMGIKESGKEVFVLDELNKLLEEENFDGGEI
jgi:hypothetical protein